MFFNKKVLLALCLVLCSCEPEKKPEPKAVPCEPKPAPIPVPTYTNPFEKPAPPPPVPVHEDAKPSQWLQVGGEFKLNGDWSLFTWRDSANHNICYFYNLMDKNRGVIGHGMSCVRE